MSVIVDELAVHASISDQPLIATDIVDRVRRDDCGAIVTFEGTVRSPDRGRRVDHLEYEAWVERAIQQLKQVTREVLAKHGAHAGAVVHRTGMVQPGEPAIVLSVAAPHRGAAFAAASELMERIKAEVAIWKRQVDTAGAAWAE